MLLFSMFIAATFVAEIYGIPVPNGVEGEPEIECGPTAITVNFNTQDRFEGHVYVKGLWINRGCRTGATNRQVAGITLPFDTCGVERIRSLNPRGIFVRSTVVITFHPQFITKVDRAYQIQCFYMEADKTVDSALEVSMLTTGQTTQNVPMPVCRYEIRQDGPQGPLVTFALVGDKVYHKWTCDTETTDTFCMWVYDCFVDDTSGDRVTLLDADGCALDKYVLNNLQYPTDLMAGVDAHVFKYADRNDLYFNCQIRIVIKEPFEQCPRPVCRDPPNRRKRMTSEYEASVLDVSAKMSTFDIDETTSSVDNYLRRANVGIESSSSRMGQVCVQTHSLLVFLSVSLSLVLIAVTLTVCFLLNRSHTGTDSIAD